MVSFCQVWCDPSQEEEIIDWSGSSETIVEGTLRREHLLVKLQELEDSQSAHSAESALKALNAALSEDDALYLRWMQRAGTVSVIQKVLTREDQKCRPRPSVAAPLLTKFAKHDPLMMTTKKTTTTQPPLSSSTTTRVANETRISSIATYLLRRA